MPRIAAGSLAEHRELVHRRVFEAFAELVAERSYDAVSMAQIAERAGIGRTAIYHHFHDKEAVAVGFATEETARYLDELRAELAAADDVVERLRVYVGYQLQAGERFHMGLGTQLYGALSPAGRIAIRDHVLDVEGVLRSLLTEGRDTGALVVDDLDATVSLIHACLGPRHLPAQEIQAFVLRAVGVEDATSVVRS